MGWNIATIDNNTEQAILCKKCRQPVKPVMRADNPKAFDFPLRFSPHNCKKQKKNKVAKDYQNPSLGRFG